MPRVTGGDQTGAIGITVVQRVVEEQLGWIFRREEHRDTGIDAQVEVVLQGKAMGLVLGLQIKTGASYFSEQTASGWKYRGDYDHLEYWKDHNLAVVVVLVNPDSGTAYWSFVGPGAKLHEAKKSWTVEVTRKNEVSLGCRIPWMDLAFAANPRDALYRYCAIQTQYIEFVVAGGRLFVEVDEWVNKTRGQAEFRLIYDDEKGNVKEESFFVFAGVDEAYAFVQRVFPWASVYIDDDFYEQHEEIEPEAIFQDDEAEGGYYVIEGERPTGVRPYADAGGGEVALYRFELTLNDVGRAFDMLATGAQQLPEYPPYYFAKVLG